MSDSGESDRGLHVRPDEMFAMAARLRTIARADPPVVATAPSVASVELAVTLMRLRSLAVDGLVNQSGHWTTAANAITSSVARTDLVDRRLAGEG